MNQKQQDLASLMRGLTNETSRLLTPMGVSFIVIAFTPEGDALSGLNGADPLRVIGAVEKFCAQSREAIEKGVIRSGPGG